jgi:serine/threonine protein kinase
MRLVAFVFLIGALASNRARKRVRVVEREPIRRVVEYYNFTAIELDHGPEFTIGLHAQLSEDAAGEAYLPNSNGTQSTPQGVLTLGPLLVAAHESVIYTVEGDDSVLVKFQANCNEAEANDKDGAMYIHPLLVDYWFSKKASTQHVGPEVTYLSPPGPLCETKTEKCAFRMTDIDFENCKSRPNVSLRYMLMHRVPGPNLDQFKHRFVDGVVSFPHALLIGYGLVKKIQILHNTTGFVHGDIHLSNIMLKSISNTNGTVDVRLIDYGRSFGNTPRSTRKLHPFGWSAHPLLSQWELEGFHSAPRDDVARAVHAISQLIQPWGFMLMEDVLAGLGASNMLQHKRTRNLLAMPFITGQDGYLYSPVDVLPIPLEYKTEIKLLLDEILTLVRGMTEVNSVPPYADILACFRDARRYYMEGVLATTAAQ